MSYNDQRNDDEGTIAAILEQTKRRIPNLLAIKKRLEDGDTLSKLEIERLGSHIKGSEHTRELIERHPEYQELAARVASLYQEITELAVANEENRKQD